MIKLGDLAKDTITGFEGVVIAITEWLHGCRRMTLQPKALKDGSPIASATFDEPQLELIGNEVSRHPVRTGGPQAEPSKHSIES